MGADDEASPDNKYTIANWKVTPTSQVLAIENPAKKQKTGTPITPTIPLYSTPANIHPDYRTDVMVLLVSIPNLPYYLALTTRTPLFQKTPFPTVIAEITAHKACISYHLRVQLWKQRDIPPKERNSMVTTVNTSAGVPKATQSQLENHINEVIQTQDCRVQVRTN